MKGRWLLFFLVLFTAGCARVASLSKDIPVQADKNGQLCLCIVSEPPGVSIDIDGYYAGKTPLVWMAPKEKYASKPIAVIARLALRSKPALKRVFCSFYEMPRTVYFDMSQSR